MSPNASPAPNLTSYLNAKEARRNYARKLQDAKDHQRQRHRRATERLPSQIAQGSLYSYAADRASFVGRRTSAVRPPDNGNDALTLAEHKALGRLNAGHQHDFEKGKADCAAFRAWATSLDTVESTGTGGVSLPSPEGITRQQAAALCLWQRANDARERTTAAEVGECGSYLWVALGPDGPCTLRNRCRHRCCPACREHRGYQISVAASTLMASWHKTKFLTLTRAPRDLTLRDTVQSLLHDFNRLRRTAIWKACLKEGIYVVEIKRNYERTHWHVHLHILTQGRFIPQAELSLKWKAITGDSTNVWITKAVPSHAQYLSKYIAKGSPATFEPWEEWAYWQELQGVKLCGTFGGAPGIADLQPEPVHTLIAPLHIVQTWASEGDPWARELLAQIAARMLQPEPQEHG